MDGASGSNVGGKRRFPLWMLGVSGADKVQKSDDPVGNNQLDDAHAPVPVPKVRRAVSKTGTTTHGGKDLVLCDNDPVKETSCILTKCETKRKKKSSRRGVDNDDRDDIPESETTVPETAPQKRPRRKNLRLRSIQESDELSQSDDDGELTMEDLMSIANEYVKADKDVEQQHLSNRDCEREGQPQSIASSGNVSRVSFSDPQTNENLPAHEATAYSYNSSDSLTNEGVAVSTSRTGDPAQDMLNLFLGPLLTQPREEEKNTKIIVGDMKFDSEYRKHSQNASVGEELVTLMKKKSSLKDKKLIFSIVSGSTNVSSGTTINVLIED